MLLDKASNTFYLSMALEPFVDRWPLSQRIDFYTFGSIPWEGDQPVGKPLPAYRTTQKKNKHTHIRVRFEHTIPVFERAKTVHALAHAASLIGMFKKTTLSL
jgi:hypothetical protein